MGEFGSNPERLIEQNKASLQSLITTVEATPDLPGSEEGK